MDDSVERRLRFWEDKVNGFRIAGEGLKGGFPKADLGPDATTEDRIAEMTRRINNFNLVPDADGVQVQGNIKAGFSVKSDVFQE